MMAFSSRDMMCSADKTTHGPFAIIELTPVWSTNLTISHQNLETDS